MRTIIYLTCAVYAFWAFLWIVALCNSSKEKRK